MQDNAGRYGDEHDPIDARILGDWTSADGKENVKIREPNGTTYLVLLNGDPFRVYHSDFAGVPFVTAQDLDGPAQKFAYLKYALAADGEKLTVHAVNAETIPKTVKTSGEARRLLRRILPIRSCSSTIRWNSSSGNSP